MENSLHQFKEYQRRVQDLQNKMSERGNELFEEKFLNAPFPAEPSPNWKAAAGSALIMDSPKVCQVDSETYKRLYDKAEDCGQWNMTYKEFATFSNALEPKGPEMVGMYDIDKYIAVVEEAERYVKVYADRLQAVGKEIDEQIKIEFQAESDGIEAINPNKKNGLHAAN